jgi:predicted metal-dependent peptidase
MSDNIPVKLKKAFFKIISSYPHYAFVLLRKEVVYPSNKNNTAWTNYRQIGFSPTFIDAENDDGVLFAVAHENMHIILQHDIRGVAMSKRYNNFDWKEWNICCDLEINPNLLDEGFRAPISIQICLDSKYNGMCAEQIYRLRMKDKEDGKQDNQPDPMGDVEPPKKNEEQSKDDDKSSEEDKNESSEDENNSDENDNSDSQNENSDNNEDDDSSNNEESSDDGEDGEDSNESGDDSNESNENSDQSDNNSENSDESNGNPSESNDTSDFTEDELNDLKVEREIETKRAFAIAKQKGKLPAYVEDIIKTIPPKNDIRDFLIRFLNDRCRSDYTYARPNKRYIPYRMYLPSLYSQSFEKVILVIDTSGSIGDEEISKFGGLVQDCLDFYSQNGTTPELQVIYCDTQVQRVDIVDETYKWDNVPRGGGTDFSPPFIYVEEEDLEPAALIYLTDGYGNCCVKTPEYPVLWALIAPNYHFMERPPFGEVMVMS